MCTFPSLPLDVALFSFLNYRADYQGLTGASEPSVGFIQFIESESSEVLCVVVDT